MIMHLPENVESVAARRNRAAALLLAAILAALPVTGSAATQGTTSDAAVPEAGSSPAALPGTASPDAASPSAAAAGANADPAQQCEVPPELSPPPDPLSGLAGALKEEARPVTIVVLSSLAAGPQAQARGGVAFAARLQAQLRSELAARGVSVPLTVQTVGKPRAPAGELAALIRRQVLPLKPALVIWSVGRVDARQGTPPHRFSQSLEKGLDILQQQGIDTILADIQYHPQFEALYRTDDYRNYVRWVAGKLDLPLLRRYEMIEHWALSGAIDLDSGNDADQRAAYDFIQECLAHQAARMIVGGAGL
jgi:hypothetical protein